MPALKRAFRGYLVPPTVSRTELGESTLKSGQYYKKVSFSHKRPDPEKLKRLIGS